MIGLLKCLGCQQPSMSIGGGAAATPISPWGARRAGQLAIESIYCRTIQRQLCV